MRAFKIPRVYSILYTYHSGKIVSEMLGVAFNNVQSQKFYDKRKNREYWKSYGRFKEIKLVSEKLSSQEFYEKDCSVTLRNAKQFGWHPTVYNQLMQRLRRVRLSGHGVPRRVEGPDIQ